jgi:proline dehydrogenase
MKMKVMQQIIKTMASPLAKRFIAGPSLEDALVKAGQLNSQGLGVILNFLAEDTRTMTQVHENLNGYSSIINALAKRPAGNAVSIKPSALGLLIEPGIYWNCLNTLAMNPDLGQMELHIDAEELADLPTEFSMTIRLKKEYPALRIRQALPGNYPGCLEALKALTRAGVGIRLCKGAYASSLSQKKAMQNILLCIRYTRESDPGLDVHLGTHDERLLRTVGQAVKGYEFLLGLKRHLWTTLKSKGNRVMIYVPYGRAWEGYAKRRWIYVLKRVLGF